MSIPEKPFFSREKIAAVLYLDASHAVAGDGEEARPLSAAGTRMVKKAARVITDEIEASLEKSGEYLAELVADKGYYLQDIAYATGISDSMLCKIIGKVYYDKGSCRSIPWLNAEILTARILGIPCSDLYMGENEAVLLPKRYVPILENLRTASAAERKAYEGIIWEELEKAREREAELPPCTDAQRKARNASDRLEDLAGDRFANPNELISMPISARQAFKDFYRHINRMKTAPDAVEPPTTKTLIRIAVLADVPVDFLVADHYLQYLGAAYYDREQEYRNVPKGDMKWLAEAAALSREACIAFCGAVLARMLRRKVN